MLGNIEIIKASMEKNEKELKTIEKKRDTLLENITALTTTLNMISKDGNPSDIYNQFLIQRSKLELGINNIPESVLQFDENQIIKFEKEDSKIESKLETVEERLNEILDKESTVRSSLESNKVKFKSLFDEAILNDAKERLSNAEKALEFYINCFKSLGFDQYSNITENEYQFAVTAIENFNNTVYAIGDQYSSTVLQDAIKYINKDYKEIDYNSLILNLKSKLDGIKESIQEQNR